MPSADNLCKQFGPRSGPMEKVNFEKQKASRRQQRHEKLPSVQRVKEGVDAYAIVRLDDEQSNVVARLHSCSGSHVPSLVTYVISA